jgi:predicted DNA-binding transcriptional regulator YafY
MREEKYSRHWRLLAFILDSAGGKRIDQLARELECSTRTVRRDLAMLQVAGFPIRSDKAGQSTLWKIDSMRTLPPVPISMLEVLALVFGRSALRAQGYNLFCEQFDSILNKLGRVGNKQLLQLLENADKSVLVDASPTGSDVEAAKCDTIAKGILEKRKLVTDYKNSQGERTKRRLLAPMTLWFLDEKIYLIAYCYVHRQVRTFSLGRMKNLSLTEEKFVQEWTFEPNRYVRGSLGPFHTDPEPVELCIIDRLEDYFRENPIHSSQVLERRNGQLIAKLHVGINETLVHELLGFGDHVRVLAPSHLADKVMVRHIKAAAQYEIPGPQPETDLPLVFD